MSAKRFKKIAVLKGGPSAEREVSLRSGSAVADGLRSSGYEVVEIDVTAHSVDIPDGVEAVFIALHGEFGEDGQIQSLLEDRAVPYTGSGPEASRAAFDKCVSKELLLANGVSTPDYETLARGSSAAPRVPVVMKPARQGSSIGVHLVFAENDWASALEDAFRYDREVIVEDYIKGRELTIGIVGGRALPAIEVVTPGEWYSYEAKYASQTTQYIVPAPLTEDVARDCAAVALRTFEVLGCRGLARVDIRLSETGELFVLELNSIPGFTKTSLLPKAAKEAGMDFPQLCSRIMELATVG